MNKILGISIAAMLAVSPMLANATGATPGQAATSAEPFAGVTVTTTGDDPETGHIASTAYVKGAYNAAIDAVNTRLQNDESTPVNISRTVKRTLGPASGTGAATDTELVTAKAVRDAIDSAAGSASTALSAAAGDGLVWDSTNFDVNLKKDASNNDANISGLEIASDELSVKTGNGITINSTSGAVEANLTTNGGLTTTGTDGQKTISVNAGNGLEVPASGDDAGKVMVKLDGTTLARSANGLKVNSITTSQIDSASMQQGTDTYASSTALTSKGYVDQQIATAQTGKATETGVNKTIESSYVTVYTDWANPTYTNNIGITAAAYTTTGTAIPAGVSGSSGGGSGS